MSEAQEHAEHIEHISHTNKKIALMIAVLALFLALSETLGKSAQTKECLILSRAKSYRGWQKQPSRFLVEMGLIGPTKNR
jgi:hypothetical protein